MRDLQRLEQLSSATALGFWAEDVILGMDRIMRLRSESAEDRDLLTEAAEILDAAVERSQEPFAAVGGAKSVAATDTALGVAENLAKEDAPDRAQGILQEVAKILRAVAAGEAGSVDVNPAITFFAAVGKQQLAVGNSVFGYGGGARAWAAGPVTSNSS